MRERVAVLRQVRARRVVFLVLAAFTARERAVVQGLARQDHPAAQPVRFWRRAVCPVAAVSVVAVAAALRGVTAASVVQLRLPVLRRRLRLTVAVVVAVGKTRQALMVRAVSSSSSGMLNAEGDLSRLPVMWGHA